MSKYIKLEDAINAIDIHEDSLYARDVTLPSIPSADVVERKRGK